MVIPFSWKYTDFGWRDSETKDIISTTSPWLLKKVISFGFKLTALSAADNIGTLPESIFQVKSRLSPHKKNWFVFEGLDGPLKNFLSVRDNTEIFFSSTTMWKRGLPHGWAISSLTLKGLQPTAKRFASVSSSPFLNLIFPTPWKLNILSPCSLRWEIRRAVSSWLKGLVGGKGIRDAHPKSRVKTKIATYDKRLFHLL